MKVSLTREQLDLRGGGWSVSGTADFVPNADVVGALLVPARVIGGAGGEVPEAGVRWVADACQAVWWMGRGVLAEREVAIAKLKCNEAYKRTTLDAHQLHGGMGYLRETDLHLWSERAKVTELLGGAWDAQIGRIEHALGLTG